MESKKRYYRDIDLIRVLSCLAILLYHFNILKGGYLAVAVFFVLSGYLACMSAFRKKKFSLVQYYQNRFFKIYVPLVVVIFLSIFVISLLPDVIWLNLKPETTSALLGYNNFWQLHANLDYFARHINSPFIHLWYIAILLQFEIVFPFIYLLFQKIGEKIHKIVPCLGLGILSIVGMVYFYHMSISQNMMITYYDTFARVFSLLCGVALGFVHCYYGSFIPNILQKKVVSRIVFYGYLCVLVGLFIWTDATSKYWAIAMIAATIISMRLIDYGTVIESKSSSVGNRVTKFFANISYEVYLFQYPIIYVFQYLPIYESIKIPMIIFSVLVLSCLMHFYLSGEYPLRGIQKLCYIPGILLGLLTLYGGYQYVLAEDHTEEMKKLEELLEGNEKIVEQKQEEYAKNLQQEQDDWFSTLEDLENNENEIKEVVKKLPVVGVGDSIMLGAVDNLYGKFPNGYFDAKVSRSVWVANDILLDLKKDNLLGNPVVLNLGANGDCTLKCKREIVETCGDRDVFWITVTNDDDVHVNDKLFDLAKDYDNLHIIDWNKKSKGHSEYFYSDGIHLTPAGRKVYAQLIYDSIYGIYAEKYEIKKQEIIKQHEEEMKNKISFYGNSLLLNAFDNIQSIFSEANFIVYKEFPYSEVNENIDKAIEGNLLTYKIVFAFDTKDNFSKEEYESLIEKCKNHEIYILAYDKKTMDSLSQVEENVHIIPFYLELENHDEYFMADGVHLNAKGNEVLANILKQEIQ